MRSLTIGKFTVMGLSLLLAILCGVFLLSLHLPESVLGATIAPNTVLTGNIQWIETPPNNARGFSYAILFVDGEAKSVNNSLPLRFDLDTTKFEDGSHVLQVVYYDANAKMASSPQTTVTIRNTTVPSTAPVLRHAASISMPITAAVTPTPQVAKQRFTIVYRDQPIDLKPFKSRQSIMVMLRPLALAAGGAIRWENKTAIARINGHEIAFKPNSKIALFDGSAVKLAHPVIVRDNRTFAPVTLWRDLFHGDTEYDARTRSVVLGEIGISPLASK